MRSDRFWTKRTGVALASLAFTYLFFLEYLPPFVRVHLFSDIEAYHYPLLEYSLHLLKQGRLPAWDPTIYCGQSLVGNINVALFYPPNWILFAVNLHRAHLSYKTLEGFVMLHIWLSFFLSYLWFRGRKLDWLASALGAGAFAYCGHMMSQDNHVGVVSGLAWTPLALWGIDEAVGQRDWRPLWKVAIASSMCFLAGFPPTWLAFCTVVGVYALVSAAHWRAAAGAALALAFSVLLVMVQLLPAYEATAFKSQESNYGLGIREWEFFAAYFVPNYFDLGHKPYGWGAPPGQYLYVGVAVLFGLLWLAWRRNLRAHLQALAIAAVALLVITNPHNVVWNMVQHSRVLSQICRPLNFLEALVTVGALIAAVSIDDFLRRGPLRLPRWLLPLSIALFATWTARQLWIWLPGGPDFAARWNSAVDAVVMLVLFTLGLCIARSEQGRRRTWIAATLLIGAGLEYKVFGTARGFDAVKGDADKHYMSAGFPGFDHQVYRQLLANHDYRIALDQNASPHATSLHHYRLATPQGFDPFLSAEYRNLIDSRIGFATNRRFWIKPGQKDTLRLLGVRYFVTMPNTPTFKALSADPDYRLIEPSRSYFAAFEYLKAEPPYRWDGTQGSIVRTEWLPDRRRFRVRSDSGGRFVLVEQFFPGWKAWLDGRPVDVERWNGAFQGIRVPPGEHQIVFAFHPRTVYAGAVVSVVSLIGLFILVRRRKFAPAQQPGFGSRSVSAMTETTPVQGLLSVLVPLYNEEEFIGAVLERVLSAPLPGGLNREIIVVDDGSSDGSAEAVEEIASREPATIHLIRHPQNLGKGAAVRTAIGHARGEFAIIQDADLEYDPAEYAKLLKPLLDGNADVVYGSRFTNSGERRVLYFWHEIANRVLTGLCNLFADLNLTDMETCYKAFRMSLLKTIPIRSDRFGIEPELTIKAARRHARMYETAISYHGRTYEEGKKVGMLDAFEAVYVIFRTAITTDICKDSGPQTLAALSGAPRFNRWMADTIRPYLGDRVLEIGAGIGNLARAFVPHRTSYVATDIDPEHLSRLRNRFHHRPRLRVCRCDLSNPADFAPFAGQMDSVICLNVLEHIEDDLTGLSNMHFVLRPGGRAIVLVPHDSAIYGTLDKALGHHRRYSRMELRTKMEQAGFHVERILDFNRISRPAWYVTGRILKSTKLNTRSLQLFDRFVWLWRLVDELLPWPATSIIAIGTRTE